MPLYGYEHSHWMGESSSAYPLVVHGGLHLLHSVPVYFDDVQSHSPVPPVVPVPLQVPITHAGHVEHDGPQNPDGHASQAVPLYTPVHEHTPVPAVVPLPSQVPWPLHTVVAPPLEDSPGQGRQSGP